MKKPTVIKGLAVALLIIAPIGLLYVFIGPGFEISITHSWGRVTHDSTEINMVIAINNPTPFSRWLKKISFDLYINDLKVAMGRSEHIHHKRHHELWIFSSTLIGLEMLS